MWITADEFDFCVGTVPGPAGTTSWPAHQINTGKYGSGVAMITLNSTYAGATIYCLETATGDGSASTAWTLIGSTSNIYYRKTNTGASAIGDLPDTYGARALFPAAGLAVATTGAGCAYLIEFKSDDLDDGYPYFAVTVSAAALSTTCALAVDYILKPRYPQNTMLLATS
jgi:hypothetical protein